MEEHTHGLASLGTFLSDLVSAASAWQIATKVTLGKLPTASDLAADFSGHLERDGFQVLAISAEMVFGRVSYRARTRTPLTAC